MASGEFSGDGEEGEGHIYSTENQNAWLSAGIAALSRYTCLCSNRKVLLAFQEAKTFKTQKKSDNYVAFLFTDFVTGVPKGLMLYGLVRSSYVLLDFCSTNRKREAT